MRQVKCQCAAHHHSHVPLFKCSNYSLLPTPGRCINPVFAQTLSYCPLGEEGGSRQLQTGLSIKHPRTETIKLHRDFSCWQGANVTVPGSQLIQQGQHQSRISEPCCSVANLPPCNEAEGTRTSAFVPSFNPQSSTGLTKRYTRALEAAPHVITTLNTLAEIFTLKLGHLGCICSLLFQSLSVPHLVTLDN